MSVEITLYSENATKQKLINFLTKEGFIKTNHILGSFNNKNHLHYHWFNNEDFYSLDGVEASIYHYSVISKKINANTEWILNTRTRSIASREDKEKQNEIIKKAKHLFGGHFDNDSYGKNKYINLANYTTYTPLEKGLFLMYSNVQEKLDKVLYSLNYEDIFENNNKDIKDETFKNFILKQNPNIIVFNALMPFLVSIIEYILSTVFILMLKYNELAFLKLSDENIKIHIKDVIKISNNENHIAHIIAENINFQNIDIANKEFKKYFSIDLNTILYKEVVLNKKSFFLNDIIFKIIQSRHKMIHEFSFDYSYSKITLKNDIQIIKLFLNEILNYLKEKEYINNKIQEI